MDKQTLSSLPKPGDTHQQFSSNTNAFADALLSSMQNEVKSKASFSVEKPLFEDLKNQYHQQNQKVEKLAKVMHEEDDKLLEQRKDYAKKVVAMASVREDLPKHEIDAAKFTLDTEDVILRGRNYDANHVHVNRKRYAAEFDKNNEKGHFVHLDL